MAQDDLTSTAPIRIAVVGAHLSGQPLHHEIADRGATLVASTRTAPCYRLFALDTTPPKPGLVRQGAGEPGGASIEVEVWELGAGAFGDFVSRIPAPLGIGKLLLDDGSEVSGFICEPYAIEGAREITQFGGWRAFRAQA